MTPNWIILWFKVAFIIIIQDKGWNDVKNNKNQRAYLAIPVGDIKGLMILKNVLSCLDALSRPTALSK